MQRIPHCIPMRRMGTRYILVSQNSRQIEIYRRRNDWKPDIIQQGDFHLDCLDLSVNIEDVYIDVTL
jgi:hypothetical protein